MNIKNRNQGEEQLRKMSEFDPWPTFTHTHTTKKNVHTYNTYKKVNK